MGLTNRKDIFYGSSFCFFLVLSLCICGVSSANEFGIFRGKYDIFANLRCYDDGESSKCTGSQCSQYEANCIGGNNCKYCLCRKNNKDTLIVTAEDESNVDGVCKSVEEILPGCFMAYLELGETGPKAAMITTSASTFTEITDCRILKTFQFTQNGKQWKDKTGPPLMLKEINAHKIELEINSTEEFKFWNGSLLNITIACDGDHSLAGNEKHCVLLKLESLPRYDEIVEPVARVAITNREYHNKNNLMDFLMNNGNSFFASEDQEDNPAPTTQDMTYYTHSTEDPYTFHTTTPPYYMTDTTVGWEGTTRSYWGTTRSYRGPTRSYRGPTTRSYRGPTRSYRGPTTRSYRGPTRFYRGPTTRSYRGPTRPYRGPTRSYRGPTTRSYRGSTTGSSNHVSSQESQKGETSGFGQKNTVVTAVTVTLVMVALALALGYLVYWKRNRVEVPQNNNDLGVVNCTNVLYERTEDAGNCQV